MGGGSTLPNPYQCKLLFIRRRQFSTDFSGNVLYPRAVMQDNLNFPNFGVAHIRFSERIDVGRSRKNPDCKNVSAQVSYFRFSCHLVIFDLCVEYIVYLGRDTSGCDKNGLGNHFTL